MQRLRVLFIVDSNDDLPQTKSETEKIISLLSQNSRVDYYVLEGRKATYGEVRSILTKEYFDILHVATHAKFDDSSREESGIVLYDGILRIQPWLVFMNACESSRSQTFEKYTELSGLASSFLTAGATSYIGTNALINDWSSSQIAVKFYQNIIKGNTIGESLKNAKLEYFNTYRYDASWSTFILYGNPNLKIEFSIERDYEREITNYLREQGRAFTITKCARELDIDITT